MLPAFRMITTLSVLAYASILDLKSRLVPDWLWLVGFPLAAALLTPTLVAGLLPSLTPIFSVVFMGLLALGIYLAGLFGGADALALALLGLALPDYPQGFPLLDDPINMPSFTAFSNAMLLAAIIPVSNTALNICELSRGRNPLEGVEVDRAYKRIILLIATRKVSVEDLKRGLHYFPAERPVNGRRVPIIFSKAEWDFTEVLSEIERNADLYSDGVLATPTVPLVLFLTAGLAMSALGNLIFLAIF